MYMNSINSNNTDYTLSSFGNIFISSDATADPKTVTFPNGYNLDSNLAFKVVFTNGHAVDNDTANMTLNDIPVVVNRYGTLIPIPNHKLSDSSTIYSTLQSNCVLEMYYTDNYDGNDNPAFVVVGNPVVLSSTDYTIYADGFNDKSFFTKQFNEQKSYLRNQNILSNIESINISTNSAYPTVPSYDGYLFLKASQVGNITLRVYVNWNLVGEDRKDGSYLSTTSMTIPIKKGDAIYTSVQCELISLARYYKLRDYTGRWFNLREQDFHIECTLIMMGGTQKVQKYTYRKFNK